MEENLLYMPPTCKYCNKLDPKHVLIKYNDYMVTFDKYDKFNKIINNNIFKEIGGENKNNLMRYPCKLFYVNGYYR